MSWPLETSTTSPETSAAATTVTVFLSHRESRPPKPSRPPPRPLRPSWRAVIPSPCTAQSSLLIWNTRISKPIYVLVVLNSCSDRKHSVNLSLETKRNYIPPILGFGETVPWEVVCHLPCPPCHPFQTSLLPILSPIFTENYTPLKNMIDLTNDRFRFEDRWAH